MFNVYSLMKLLFTYFHHLLYKKITVIDRHHVPSSEPIIIFSNHNNHYLDASIIVQKVNRPITLIVAALVLKNPVAKIFLENIDHIPIKRTRDCDNKVGKGHIIEIRGQIMKGQQTEFSELKMGEYIYCAKKQFKILEVIGDYQLKVSNRDNFLSQDRINYKIYPKIKRQNYYSLFQDRILKGKAIYICPEGVTHDQLQLLPFKEGICVTAFNLLEKNKIKIHLVPLGMTFCKHHLGRSEIILKFGKPVTISDEIFSVYLQNNEEGVYLLKKELQKCLKNNMIETSQFSTLEPLINCRKLYCGEKMLSSDEKFIITQIFAKAFQNLKQNQQFISFKQKLLEYCSLKDEIMLQHASTKKLLETFIKILLKFIVSFILSIPGFLLFEPILFFVKKRTQKDRKVELTKSEHRISAQDVIGTYMSLNSMKIFPKCFLFLFVLIFFFLDFSLGENILFCCMLMLICFLYSIFYVKLWDVVVKERKKLKPYIQYFMLRKNKDSGINLKVQVKQRLHKLIVDHPQVFRELK